MGKLASKQKTVENLKEKIGQTQLAVVTDYTGFTVGEISELRNRLYETKADFKVAKNTLIKRAIKETNLKELESLLEGPSGLLLGYDEPTTATKALLTYIKEIEKGDVKGGVFEGKLMSKAELKAFADLPSKEVLLGQIAGLLVANTRDIAGILEGIIRDNALLIEEVAKKQAAKAA